ncbi:MAG: TrkH family potassium uptake protein [Acholeplasmataceae bacterium]
MKKTVTGYRLIFGYLGIFMMMVGLINFLPIIVIIFYPEDMTYINHFLLSGTVSIIMGYGLFRLIKNNEKGQLERHQDVILIFLVWTVAILLSSIPFLLLNDFNLTQSIFEVTSGYSTTGLTVVNVSHTPKIYLMFRSLMQFFGGIGLVLVLTSAISDKYGMRLYNAEGHNDKLLPNLAKSARLIISLYITYIALGTLLYVIFNMSFFDAINHSIAAVSTGGFSTRQASIGHYNNVGIEIITIVLMLLGSTNLVIHLNLFKGRIKKIYKHIELKLLLGLTIVLLPLMTLSILSFYDGRWGYAIRHGIFQFVSAATTTGFQTVESFDNLPYFFLVSVIILMIIGGGIGSTAGGIKQYRIGLALKHLIWNIRTKMSHQKTIHAHSIYKFDQYAEISAEDINQNNAHIFLYVGVLWIGVMAYSAAGYDLMASLFEFASALGTVGLSIGIIGPNISSSILWTTTIGMFLGRLEFFVIIIALTQIGQDIFTKRAYK